LNDSKQHAVECVEAGCAAGLHDFHQNATPTKSKFMTLQIERFKVIAPMFHAHIIGNASAKSPHWMPHTGFQIGWDIRSEWVHVNHPHASGIDSI